MPVRRTGWLSTTSRTDTNGPSRAGLSTGGAAAVRDPAVSVGASSEHVAASPRGTGVHRSPPNRGPYLDVRAQPHGSPVRGAATPEFPRHVVTAVLVSHDGARWLPDALAGLLGQERPVQNVIAADTGSADDSARLLTEALGADRVLHLARRTGFGSAVDEAARTAGVLTPDDLPYLKRPSGWDPVTRTLARRRLRHAGAAARRARPVAVAAARRLRARTRRPRRAAARRRRPIGRDAAVVGPKLRGWYDRRQLLEVGVSIANSGRRWTGLDRREQDQGQHDQVRTVLSVSTAGMLIRRDVFEQLGGFDRRLPLMRDDVDLCWRAHAAGHRVLDRPRRRRTARRGGLPRAPHRRLRGPHRRRAPHRVDKAGAVYTLLANARTAQLPWVLLRLVLGTLLRTLAYLVGKVPGQALDEVTRPPGHPAAPRADHRRAAQARAARRSTRPNCGPSSRRPARPCAPPSNRSPATSAAAPTPKLSAAGRHGGASSPGPAATTPTSWRSSSSPGSSGSPASPARCSSPCCSLVSLVACRELLGGGALAGGALLPAPADVVRPVGALRRRLAPRRHRRHPDRPALPRDRRRCSPPCFFGSHRASRSPLLLVCSVPLAGLTAYFASRPLVESRLLRAWASVAYAFLPAATGALAGGRIGTAVLAILLPLIARAGVAAVGLRAALRGRAAAGAPPGRTRCCSPSPRRSPPIVWPIALVLGRRAARPAPRATSPALRDCASCAAASAPRCWSSPPGRCPC